MKRMRMNHIWHAIAVALLIAGCSAQPGMRDNISATQASGKAATSTVAPRENFVNAHAIIIVRHADIDTTSKTNATPLLERGQQRAKELITALKDAGVTRIVTSAATRTKETAAPLAAELHLTPEDPSARGTSAAQFVRYLAETAKPEQTILVVQHHSSLPGILAEFGFKGEPLMEDATEFDRAYVILPDAGRQTYQLLRLRYGGKW